MCKVSSELELYAKIAIKKVFRLIIDLYSHFVFAMSGSKQNIILHYFLEKSNGK